MIIRIFILFILINNVFFCEKDHPGGTCQIDTMRASVGLYSCINYSGSGWTPQKASEDCLKRYGKYMKNKCNDDFKTICVSKKNEPMEQEQFFNLEVNCE